MEQFKRILRKIFFLPLLPTVLAAVFGFGLVLAVAIFHIEIPAIQYISYIASAYALTVTQLMMRRPLIRLLTAWPREIFLYRYSTSTASG